MRNFTYKQLEQQATLFTNSNDASADIMQPDALKYRMYLSSFLVWLRRLPDDNVLNFQPTETANATNCKDDCHYVEERDQP